MLVVAGSIALSIIFLVVFFCMTIEFVEMRNKIVVLFKKIPRDTVSDIHDALVKQTGEENPTFGFSFTISNRFFSLDILFHPIFTKLTHIFLLEKDTSFWDHCS